MEPPGNLTEAPSHPPHVGHTQLEVKGMSCQNCVRQVTEALKGVDGVASAEVNLEAGRAQIQWLSGATPNNPALIDAVIKAGFDARELAGNESPTKPSTWSPLKGWRFNVVAGSAVTLLLLAGEWGFGLGMEHWFQWLAFALAVPVQTICGARFYLGAWRQLKAGSSNMDTLVALGSTTAFAYSIWALLSGGHTHLYFMESTAIITLISLGHWLEAKACERAASSLRALLNLAPNTARRLDAGGRETEVSITHLQLNDLVVLKPGDRMPTDGEATEGNSAVDESMLTGESLPIDKTVGSKLYAGTVNQNGRLIMRVTATGEATALAQIIAVVRRAQSSRAQIQKLGDRVSSVFVPLVVLAAVGTGLFWGLAFENARQLHQGLAPYLWPVHLPDTPLAAAMIYAAGVLIVACPCAMGLATPVAIMAGTNVAARRGILIRDGMALEKSGRLTAILFDKTGTLSQGRVAVAAVEDYRESPARAISLHEIAASLAKPSNHPLSQAVAKMSDGALPLTEWREERGAGVAAKATIAPGTEGPVWLRLGSVKWLQEHGVDFKPVTAFIGQWSAEAATVLGLAADRQLIGLFALRDTIKPYAAAVVKQLQRQGLATYLVTGDYRPTALAIAKQADIPENHVFAEVRPEQKASLVSDLQQQGQRVAFVGDGINDAPALEQADLGIAVSRASDVAREAADIILLKSDIQTIPEALNLARITLRTIKQNLFWAFFYNAAAVPLAALGYLSPILCAAAMGVSDLIVIGNALRLQRYRFQ